MVTPGYRPARGDLIWLTFTPQAGHEQAGRRPALVLSPLAFNARTGLAFVSPITSRVRGRPFEVVLPAGGAVEGVILTDQTRSVDWMERKAAFIANAGDAALEDALSRLEAILGFGG